MINEDWERISLQESIYLQEERYLFDEEMKTANPHIDRLPATVINLSKNEHNPITLRGNNKEELQSGHNLHASVDQGED
jgi:hypothetical protein